MIDHLVLMKLTDANHATEVVDQVLSLNGQIPDLLAVRGGPSVVSLASTWHVGFVLRFTNPEAVVAYQTHPAHVAVGAAIRAFISELATCDLAVESSS